MTLNIDFSVNAYPNFRITNFPSASIESNSSTATIRHNNTYLNPIRSSAKRSRALASMELAKNLLLDCLPDW